MHHFSVRALSAAVVAVLSVAVASCSAGGGSDGSDTTTSADETTTTVEETTTTEAEPEPEPEPEPEQDEELEGGLTMVGDKSVLLDGFVGVEIPAGWGITSTDVPTFSTSPPEGETEIDPDALTQSLVINPEEDPMGASFALVHYEHSDSVPDLAAFSDATSELLTGDGSKIGEGTSANIGGQEAVLYQVQSASGANGLMVTLESGGEYFFIISITTDSSYSEDAAAMLSSVSFVPEALHS